MPPPLSSPLLSPPIPKSSPLGLSHSNPSSLIQSHQNNRYSQSEWWKWSTPTKEDYQSGSSKTSPGLGNNKNNNSGGKGLMGRKRGEEEVKMVGDWRVGKGIGKGTSGKVRIARHTVTNEYSAIKMIRRPPKFDLDLNRNTIHREITVMKLVESPYVVRLLDVFQTESHIYLVTEYCELGELFHFFTKRRLSEELVHKLFSQLVTALSHLKLHNIAHRDIKFENLLLDTNYNLKLADFGMAIFCPLGSLLDTSCGSPHYAAPEVIEGVPYDGKIADIWSCGIVLYAMISRHLPFDDDNISTLLGQIKTGQYSMHSDIQGEAKDLVEKILVVDPTQRITLEEIILHPYLQLYGEYIPTPYDLPFPLSEGIGHDIPTSEKELDIDLVEQLKVVLRAKTNEEVVQSVLQTKETTHAKTFYAILRNFRARAGTEDDVKDAVIATANRLVISPRRVKSADPILSHNSAPPLPNFGPPLVPTESTSLETVLSLSTQESMGFPLVESVSTILPITPGSSRISIDSNVGMETIVFPSFPPYPPDASPVPIRSGSPGSPNLRYLVPGYRPYSAQFSSQSVPSTPERALLVSGMDLEGKLISPRSFKLSIQKLKTFFSVPKSPVMEEELIEGKDKTPLHVKRSTRMSSFGKVLRFNTGSSPSDSTSSSKLDSGESSPLSVKLLRKKKSWARVDDVVSTSEGSPSPRSLVKKKSWGWNRRPTSWISSNENSPPSPTSPRVLPSQIANWIATGISTPPNSPTTPSKIVSPSSFSTSSHSPSTKRRPSPLQLSSITNHRPSNSTRPNSTFSITKRIDPPPFLSRIQSVSSSKSDSTPLTPPSANGNKSKRPVLVTGRSSISVYSDFQEEEERNAGDGDIYQLSPNVPTPHSNDGFLSPPLTASGAAYLDFLSPIVQTSRKSGSMRSHYSRESNATNSGNRNLLETMEEKLFRLERENQGLRIALDLKDQVINNGNKNKRTSRSFRGENKENTRRASSRLEKDELVDLVNKLSFESDQLAGQRWLRIMSDEEFE